MSGAKLHEFAAVCRPVTLIELNVQCWRKIWSAILIAEPLTSIL